MNAPALEEHISRAVSRRCGDKGCFASPSRCLTPQSILNHSPYQRLRSLDPLQPPNLIDDHLGKVGYVFGLNLYHDIPAAEHQIGFLDSREDAHLRYGSGLQSRNQADQDIGLDHIITPFSPCLEAPRFWENTVVHEPNLPEKWGKKCSLLPFSLSLSLSLSPPTSNLQSLASRPQPQP